MLWGLVGCGRYNWTKGHCNTIPFAVRLSKRLVSSKESESKTRSIVAAPELRIILSKAAFSCFYVFFTLWEQIFFNSVLAIWLSVRIILRFQNSHSLACFHEISWNCSLIKYTEKPQDRLSTSSWLRLLIVSDLKLWHVFKMLLIWGASNSILFSHNYYKFSAQHETDTTSDVTRLLWPRQDGRQFWA